MIFTHLHRYLPILCVEVSIIVCVCVCVYIYINPMQMYIIYTHMSKVFALTQE